MEILVNPALTAVILAVIAFLSRSIIGRWIAMSIAKYEANLQRETTEHQIRFTRLDEKRADVVAKLNGLLIAVHRDLIELDNLTPDALRHLSTLDEKRNHLLAQTINDYQTFSDYFDEHNLYLPEDLCNIIDRFLKVCNQIKTAHIQNQVLADETNASFLIASFDATRKIIPELREEIKQEFRQILGLDE